MEERLWTKKYLFSLLLVFGVNMGYALLNSVMAIYGSVLTYSSVVGGYMITVFTLSALFIRLFIKKLNEREDPVIFVLWGGNARKKKSLINNKKHYILEAAHPSPLSAYRGFFGCKHFSKINDILIKLGKTPIDWQIPNI